MHPPAEPQRAVVVRPGGCGVNFSREDERVGKVMVVDDALSELKVIEGILKSAGHQVVSYQSSSKTASWRSGPTCSCSIS